MDPLALKVAARYKSKKTVKKQDGGEMTVYEYSDRQVAKRHSDKAKRYEALNASIDKLRKQVKSDLKSKDAKTKLTALAVALIDHTYERVGNEGSADEGHFGVTGWQRRHISFGGKGATIKYVGKSGVKHEKKVSDTSLTKALKEAYDNVKGDESCVFSHEDACVKAEDVNAYLKPFKITAKDLRGYHANVEMKEALKAIRSKGPELPKDRKEKDKILKAEFKKALDSVADIVGHTASMLRGQYLVPSLEDQYIHNGEIIEKLTDKKASSIEERVVAIWTQE